MNNKDNIYSRVDLMDIEKIDEHQCFGGTQLRYSHPSKTLRCVMNFSIFLPEQAKTHKVPLLYWLSGLTCTDENFFQKAGAQRYASQYGVAIVAPDTSPRGKNVPDDPEGDFDFGLGAGFYLNATQQPWATHYRMYDYVTRELPALVNQAFPVDASRVGIFGHSMGGHGALTIALKNPDKYRSVSAFAPIVAPMRCPWGQKAFRAYLGDNQALWRIYDATELLSSVTKQRPMLIDQGEADSFLIEQLKPELLINACNKVNYPLELRMHENYDHSYYFIASFMEDHIRFHTNILCN